MADGRYIQRHDTKKEKRSRTGKRKRSAHCGCAISNTPQKITPFFHKRTHRRPKIISYINIQRAPKSISVVSRACSRVRVSPRIAPLCFMLILCPPPPPASATRALCVVSSLLVAPLTAASAHLSHPSPLFTPWLPLLQPCQEDLLSQALCTPWNQQTQARRPPYRLGSTQKTV